jgi:uncharacterized protein (TIGR00369 family)
VATLQPKNPAFADAVRRSFQRQRIMGLLGARLSKVEPGFVEIELPFREDLLQQDGFLHAGVAAAIAGSAGGYAALTPLPAGHRVLSSEVKLHFLEPAEGPRFMARGRVVRPGRSITVCELDVHAIEGSSARRCAWGSKTIMNLPPAA